MQIELLLMLELFMICIIRFIELNMVLKTNYLSLKEITNKELLYKKTKFYLKKLFLF